MGSDTHALTEHQPNDRELIKYETQVTDCDNNYRSNHFTSFLAGPHFMTTGSFGMQSNQDSLSPLRFLIKPPFISKNSFSISNHALLNYFSKAEGMPCLCCARALIECFIDHNSLSRGKVLPDVQPTCAGLQYKTKMKNDQCIQAHSSTPRLSCSTDQE